MSRAARAEREQRSPNLTNALVPLLWWWWWWWCVLADFRSRNCLRELTHALHTRRPLVLVHEPDPAKGGAPLADLRADAEASGVDVGALFDGGWPMVAWHRVSEFQLLSLRLIAEATVRAMPHVLEDSGSAKRLSERRGGEVKPSDAPVGHLLYIPGELARRHLEFPTRVVLYASAANPGAAELAAELQRKHGGGGSSDRLRGSSSDRIRVTSRPPACFTSGGGAAPEPSAGAAATSTRLVVDGVAQEIECAVAPEAAAQSVSWAAAPAPAAVLASPPPEPNHMLLYLCEETFKGPAGQTLADEIEQAWAQGLPIILAHECDPSRGGCAFARFFETTPQHLIDGHDGQPGLYHSIAIACHTRPHRAVSLALLSIACGAQIGTGPLRQAVRRASEDAVAAVRRASVSATLAFKSSGPSGRGGGADDRPHGSRIPHAGEAALPSSQRRTDDGTTRTSERANSRGRRDRISVRLMRECSATGRAMQEEARRASLRNSCHNLRAAAGAGIDAAAVSTAAVGAEIELEARTEREAEASDHGDEDDKI